MILPLHLELKGVPVLVLGGGKRAGPWVYSLLGSGAVLRVAAPDLSFELRLLAQAKKVRWLKRRPRARDLASARLLIAAAEDSALNRRFLERARARKLWAISADPRFSGSAWSPPAFRRGGLWIHFNLPGGSRPGALDREWVAYLKRRLGRVFGREWETVWEELKGFRQALPLGRLLPGWLRAVRRGRPQKIRRDLEKMLRSSRS